MISSTDNNTNFADLNKYSSQCNNIPQDVYEDDHKQHQQPQVYQQQPQVYQQQPQVYQQQPQVYQQPQPQVYQQQPQVYQQQPYNIYDSAPLYPSTPVNECKQMYQSTPIYSSTPVNEYTTVCQTVPVYSSQPVYQYYDMIYYINNLPYICYASNPNLLYPLKYAQSLQQDPNNRAIGELAETVGNLAQDKIECLENYVKQQEQQMTNIAQDYVKKSCCSFA
jgi:hypothetical protein